jgi:hypothetical protein
MPTPRYDFGVTVVNGEIYAIGGRAGKVYSGEYRPLQTNEMYDPVSDRWAAKAPMPTARFYFAIAAFQGKIYVFGGQKGYNMSGSGEPILCPSTEVYDTVTDTWETKTPMPTPRTQLSANAVGERIYLISGSKNEVYDPSTDSWTLGARSPKTVPSLGFGSAVVDNKIYFVGQEGPVQIYSASTDSWGQGASIPSWDLLSAAATIGVKVPKRVYALGGGWIFGSSLNQVYDVESDTWHTGSPMPTARNGLGLAVVDDVLYAIGGGNGGTGYDATGTNEQYTPWHEATLKPAGPSSNSQEPAPSSITNYPVLTIISPANTSYTTSHGSNLTTPLTFWTNNSLSWVGYSLDGSSNITVMNGTLIAIPVGSQNLTVYANDTAGNWAEPQTVFYSVSWNGSVPHEAPSESFPWLPVSAVSGGVAALVAVVAVVYLKKHKR